MKTNTQRPARERKKEVDMDEEDEEEEAGFPQDKLSGLSGLF